MTKINVTNNIEHNDFADILHVVNKSDILFETRICLKTTMTDTTILTLKTHSAISNGYAISTVFCGLKKENKRRREYHEEDHICQIDIYKYLKVESKNNYLRTRVCKIVEEREYPS